MALELASVSSMISEILIKIGLKMTIFIHEFFGISLDASTVSLYNRAFIIVFTLKFTRMVAAAARQFCGFKHSKFKS